MNIVKLSWKNIRFRPLSSGLSILLLATGISIILISVLTEKQLQENFERNAGGIDLVVGAKGSRLQLVLSSIYHIDNPVGNINLSKLNFVTKNPFVKSAIPIALGDSYKSHRIVGTTSKYSDLYNAKIGKGKLFEKPMDATIGSAVAEKLGLKIGSKFVGGHGLGKANDGEVLHSHDEFKYKVVGIFEQSNSVIDNLILTPVESVWVVHGGQAHDSGGSFDLKTKEEVEHLKEHSDTHKNHEHDDHQDHDAHGSSHEKHKHGEHHAEHHGHEHDHHDHVMSKEEINKILDGLDDNEKEITSLLVQYKTPRGKFTIPGMVNKSDALIAAEPAIETMQVQQLIEPAIGILKYMAIFIMAIAGLSVFIALFNSLKDRKYEIALMRVMGASSTKVFMVIIAEGVIVSFIGYCLGLLISHAGIKEVSSLLSVKYHYDFTGFLFITEEIWLLVACIFIGLLTSIAPAIKAYRTDISETLTQG